MTNAVMACESPGSPVLAINTVRLPDLPWVIKFFAPLMIQYSPSFTATVFMFPASDPVLGSVNPQAPIHSPLASLGNHFCFCSSLANCKIWLVQRELCAATDKPMEPSTLEISTRVLMYSKYPRPAPPYSTGTKIPINPSSPI